MKVGVNCVSSYMAGTLMADKADSQLSVISHCLLHI